MAPPRAYIEERLNLPKGPVLNNRHRVLECRSAWRPGAGCWSVPALKAVVTAPSWPGAALSVRGLAGLN